MILYQYRGNIGNDQGYGHLENLLMCGELYFSPPSNFNDPFDCCPAQLADSPLDDLPHAVVDNLNRGLQSAISKLHGIVSLTPHPDRMIMWSHYGDQHRGVCIGFDTEVLLESPPVNSEGCPLYESVQKVVYSSDRPGAECEKQFYTKAPEWLHEDEYRIISVVKKGKPSWGPGPWRIPVSAITEIILGARMPHELQQRVATLAKTTLPQIAVRNAVLHAQKFKILIEDHKNQPDITPMHGNILGADKRWRKT